MKWLITNAASEIGQHLAHILAENGEHVVGVDTRGQIDFSKFDEFYTIPISNYDGIFDVFTRTKPDIAVHLAILSEHSYNQKEQRTIAIDATNNIFKAAKNFALKTVVYLSSAAVYGTGPENPEYIYETYPLSGNEECYFTKLKSISDILARKYAQQFNGKTIILRPCTIIGNDFLEPNLSLLDLPIIPNFGQDVPFQFITTKDLADSIYHAVKKDVSGVFNLAGTGMIKLSKVAKIMNKKWMKLPNSRFIDSMVTIGSYLRCISIPPKMLSLLSNRWIVDASRFSNDIYMPKTSSEDALTKSYEFKKRFRL